MLSILPTLKFRWKVSHESNDISTLILVYSHLKIDQTEIHVTNVNVYVQFSVEIQKPSGHFSEVADDQK